MFLKATYTVRFKITDRELYDEFEDDNSNVVDFLSALLETVRYAEDWNKRVMETYSDEYWWDDENDYGIIEVEVTVNTEGLPETSHDSIMESISMTTGDELGKFSTLTAKEICDLATVRTEYDSYGPLAAIVWWSSMIPSDNESEEGAFLEYDNDKYLGRINNFEDHTVSLLSFTYNNDDVEIELEGDYDAPTTTEILLKQIEEYYPNFK